MTTPASFTNFGKSFQEKIVEALITDPPWAEQMREVMDSGYFEPRYLEFLVDRYFSYAEKYRAFPTLNLLISIVNDELKADSDKPLRSQICEFIVQMQAEKNGSDLPFVKEKALEFCRKQALTSALERALDHIENQRYDAVVEEVKKATIVGTPSSIGLSFFKDYDARFTRAKRNCVPTGLAELDVRKILNGGLGQGELGVVVAPTGVGKSHWLTFIGANAMEQGFNVVHYTFELNEQIVGLRYDSCLCGIDSTEVPERSADVIKSYKERSLGKLIIKQFPANSVTVYTLRSHLDRVLVQEKFRPDLIIIDYADIMRSTRQYGELRHELKLVYEELRSVIGQELMLPVWTGSQSNKEGSKADIVDLENMAEAYGKAMIADFVMGLSRRSAEKNTGVCRLYVAKNRAGADGMVFNGTINTAQSKFAIEGEAMNPSDVKAEDQQSQRERFRAAYAKSKEDINGVRKEFGAKGQPGERAFD